MREPTEPYTTKYGIVRLLIAETVDKWVGQFLKRNSRSRSVAAKEQDTDNGTKSPTRTQVLSRYSIKGFSRGRSPVIEAAWLVAQWLLVSSWLPGSLHRRVILRAFGANIGQGVVIKPGVKIKFPWRLTVGDHTWIGESVWIDNLAEVTIGSNCCISQGAYLCTGSHDWSKPHFDLITRPIRIADQAWIAARGSVAPGVAIGVGAVLGLASVATTNLAPWTIYRGNPAVPVRARTRELIAANETHEFTG